MYETKILFIDMIFRAALHDMLILIRKAKRSWAHVSHERIAFRCNWPTLISRSAFHAEFNPVLYLPVINSSVCFHLLREYDIELSSTHRVSTLARPSWTIKNALGTFPPSNANNSHRRSRKS